MSEIKNATLTDDIVSDRLTKMSYKPLSRREEVSLIKKLKLSYYEDVDDNLKQTYLDYYFEEFPEFKEEYEKSLEKDKLLKEAISKSYEYRDYFIENNRRLVFSVIKKFFAIDDKFEDLFQEGVIGMMIALEKFDFSEGNKFSTYATWWIRETIIRYCHNYVRTIRIPVHLSENIYIFRKTRDSLPVKLGREPSNQEIAIEMGINDKMLERILKAKVNCYLPSLAEPMNESIDEDVIGDFVADDIDYYDKVDTKLYCDSMMAQVKKVKLNSRDRKILSMRYGLNGEKAHTVSEVAAYYKICKQRVRTIEKSALSKIRYNLSIGDAVKNNHTKEEKQLKKVKHA